MSIDDIGNSSVPYGVAFGIAGLHIQTAIAQPPRPGAV